ncbi:MAG: NUDIX hydrolase [Chloroflexi bacterium]|nr:NUDIX hydrolase [Chloroflexota bacterium]
MPKTTVAAIVTTERDEGGRVLLIRRKKAPFKGQWCLPGGHIEQDERVQEAVVREVKEETGLNYPARFFGYFDEIIPQLGIHAVVIVFEGTGRGDLCAKKDEVEEIGWFSHDDARSLPLAFMHNEILDAYTSHIEKELCD